MKKKPVSQFAKVIQVFIMQVCARDAQGLVLFGEKTAAQSSPPTFVGINSAARPGAQIKKSKRRVCKRIRFLIALFLSIICFYNSQAADSKTTGDSLKPKYDKTDPRNPNCLCHAWQKLADKEYRRLQNNNTPAVNFTERYTFPVHTEKYTANRRPHFSVFKTRHIQSHRFAKHASKKHKRLNWKLSRINACH